MTGRSFEFHALDALVPGTVGEPGARVFYLQARSGNSVVSFRLEKEQVGMLGQYLGQLAQAMGTTEPDRDIAGLIEPIDVEWVIGSLSVGVDEDDAAACTESAIQRVEGEDADVDSSPVRRDGDRPCPQQVLLGA